MRAIRYSVAVFSILVAACASGPDPNKQIPEFLLKFRTKSFAYPIGEREYVTEKNDVWDYWYNAQDFGDNKHLGEDWNKTTGGDTDCGEPVYSAAAGEIVFAKDAGPGWGNVIMIEHKGDDGTKVRTFYGHLQSIEKSSGKVGRRVRIGTVGSANGQYKCHLHFEIRWKECPFWNEAGPGYSEDRHGWIDPSEFIELTR